MLKKLLPLIIAMCFSALLNPVVAQTAGNSIEVSPSYGIQIFSIAKYKMQGDFYGIDVAIHLNTVNDKADWVRKLHVKDITFAASYHYLNNAYLVSRASSEGIVGNTFGLSGRLSMNLADIGKTSLMFYPGFGAAYLTQNFQTTADPLIGSHLNYSITAGLKLVTPITTKTSLIYGVDIDHFSNGALSLPNEGLNIFNATIGIDQSIGGSGPKTSAQPFLNKSGLEFSVMLGRRGLVRSGGGLTGAAADQQRTSASQLYNSVFSLNYNYRVNSVLSLKVITDATYSYTKFDYNNFYATFQERATSFDRTRVGAGLGVDAWLGRVAIEGGYGHYIHFDSYYPEPWYWYSGAKLYFNHWLAAEGKIYLHGTEAELTGYGLVFTMH